MKSSNPAEILELRRDLKQWDQALALALKLSPEEVTIIAKEYAQQLEFDGKYSEAFAMYEKALKTSSQHPGSDDLVEEHQISVSAGLIRMTCRLGDVARGMKMLEGADDIQLYSDCAKILDGLKQYSESAFLYEKAGKFEKAAEIYLKAKNWDKVATLLHHVKNPKIMIQYAKSREGINISYHW